MLGGAFQPPWLDEVLGLYAEPIRDSGDVVEIANHLSGIVDGAVVEAMATQLVDVALPTVVRVVGQLLRVSAERFIGGVEFRAPPVPSNGVDEGVPLGVPLEQLLDLGTEVMRVRLRSVEAVSSLGGDYREHLALPPGQRRGAEHDGAVELHRRVHRARVLAHDVDDVPHPAGSLERVVEELLEEAACLADRHLFDVGHPRS